MVGEVPLLYTARASRLDRGFSQEELRKQSGSIPHVGTLIVAVLLCGFWFLGWFWYLLLLLWFVAFGFLLFSASPVCALLEFWTTSHQPAGATGCLIGYKRQKIRRGLRY